MLISGKDGAILCGYVARDAEVRITPNGKNVANFSIKASGGGEEVARWIKCIAWGGMATKASQIVKGDTVLAIGRMANRKWTGNDGQERTSEELTCDFILVEPKDAAPAYIPPVGTGLKAIEEDLPF